MHTDFLMNHYKNTCLGILSQTALPSIGHYTRNIYLRWKHIDPLLRIMILLYSMFCRLCRWRLCWAYRCHCLFGETSLGDLRMLLQLPSQSLSRWKWCELLLLLLLHWHAKLSTHLQVSAPGMSIKIRFWLTRNNWSSMHWLVIWYRQFIM